MISVQQKQKVIVITASFLLTICTFYFVQSKCKGEVIYGVIDRIVDDKVVFLLTDETELLLRKNNVPTEAHPGVWFRIEREGQSICSITLDYIKTKLHKQRIDTLYEQMKISPSLQRVKNRDENERNDR